MLLKSSSPHSPPPPPNNSSPLSLSHCSPSLHPLLHTPPLHSPFFHLYHISFTSTSFHSGLHSSLSEQCRLQKSQYMHCENRFTGPRCEFDVNECAQNNSCVASTMVCINTVGSYFCQCRPGFEMTSTNECKGMWYAIAV